MKVLNRSQPPPVTKYTFNSPVPFTEVELRRLAPVADRRCVLIAVEHSGGRLQIYGLIDIGMALWEMARHERIMGHASPEALIVASSRPGELIISHADRPVLRLRGGRIVTPTDRSSHRSVTWHGCARLCAPVRHSAVDGTDARNDSSARCRRCLASK